MSTLSRATPARVIDNLLSHVDRLKVQRDSLRCLSSTAAANPLLQDWAKTEPFGLPPFARIQTDHFQPAFGAAMDSHLESLGHIANSSASPTFENTIAEFDRCGGTLEQVSMVFSNLCSSLNTEPLQLVQTAMAPLLAAHDSATYTFPGLFEKIAAVHDARLATPGLGSEQLRLTERIYTDFTRAGAKFDAGSKVAYAAIMAEQAALFTQFQQNVMADESSFTIPLHGGLADLAGCPADLVEAAKGAAAEAGDKAGGAEYVITLSRSLVEPFITFSDRRDLREQAWRAWTKRGELDPARDNNAILVKILKLRKRQVGPTTALALADTGPLAD
jgi:peptidyl-dipeptidase Dcp